MSITETRPVTGGAVSGETNAARGTPGRHGAWVWLLAAAAAALLLFNVAVRVGGFAVTSLDFAWRGWDDLAIASGYAERGEFPVAPYCVTNRVRRRGAEFVAFRDALLRESGQAGLRPVRFWRPLSPGALAALPRWRVARRFDDMGRSLLLGMGFRALGGVAPFLILWLAPLALLPVLFWTAYEFYAAGRSAAGLVFLLATANSAFVVDLLTLDYSAAGFYLVSLLMIVPLAVYAALGGRPAPRGLLVRVALLSLPLGMFILCRSACLLALPGYALAIACGAWQAQPGAAPRRAALLALGSATLGTGLLTLPWLGLAEAVQRVSRATLERHGQHAPPQQAHDVWVTIWQGLGDFDRTHGHIFLDQASAARVARAGAHHQLSAQSEAIMKRLVLTSIRDEPGWYLGILVKRAAATVSLYKLWPWEPRDGRSFAPAQSSNEGVIDSYYAMIAQADWLRLGSALLELPVSLLLLPAAGLALLACAPGRGRLVVLRDETRRALIPLSCLSAGALVTPVLITTATAFEAEAFVVVHYLALALLLGTVLPSLRGPRPAAP